MQCKITKECYLPGLGICKVGDVVDVQANRLAGVIAHYGDQVGAKKPSKADRKAAAKAKEDAAIAEQEAELTEQEKVAYEAELAKLESE